ncbi:MAG: carbohydrate binding family 9 domain-containing protein [Vicinamibacterales bacterium]
MEPAAGQPATERTEIWLFFDDATVYVAMRAWESEPSRVIATEMRRDSGNIRQGDSIAFGFDTSYDRRNAFQFEVNALGARTDGQSTNERQYNGDWNPVWNVRATRFADGWSVEAALPFKSLRYRSGREQVWGFQARRISKWKNEISFLTRVPPSFGMGRGSFAASLFATVVGIEAPPSSRILEIKPSVVADVTTDRLRVRRSPNRADADARR